MNGIVGPRNPFDVIGGRQKVSDRVTKLEFPDGIVYEYKAPIGTHVSDIVSAMKHLDAVLFAVHNPIDVGDDDMDMYFVFWTARERSALAVHAA